MFASFIRLAHLNLGLSPLPWTLGLCASGLCNYSFLTQSPGFDISSCRVATRPRSCPPPSSAWALAMPDALTSIGQRRLLALRIAALLTHKSQLTSCYFPSAALPCSLASSFSTDTENRNAGPVIGVLVLGYPFLQTFEMTSNA